MEVDLQAKIARLERRCLAAEARNDALLEQNAALFKQQELLRAQIAALKAQNAALEMQLTAAKDESAALGAEVKALGAEVKALEMERERILDEVSSANNLEEEARKDSEALAAKLRMKDAMLQVAMVPVNGVWDVDNESPPRSRTGTKRSRT